MDFSLSSEQIRLRDGTVHFARERITTPPGAHDAPFPRSAWAECAEFGLLGLLVPRELGGAGLDGLTAAIVLEAFGYACADQGLVHAVATQVLCGLQLALFGSEKQKVEYLPGISAGTIIASQAMTEPDAGSDVAAMKTQAEPRDGTYLLNGSKCFITNGPICDVALTFCVTDPEKNALGRLSCLIVDRDTPGFERGSPFHKLGLHSLKNGMLYFRDCPIPEERLLGARGAGWLIFSSAIEWERVLLFATQVGKMQHVLEQVVAYAGQRKQFGRRIGEFQAVSAKVAQMRVNLELSRLIAYKAAWLKDARQPAALEASIAKLFISESCRDACLDALQIHGGYGFMEEYAPAGDLRDSLGGTIYSGTSEIQRNIIARLCGLG
jgi:alkylation response protein AidB-like acyl-CoA dehydrogenase